MDNVTRYDEWIAAQNLPACPAGLCHAVSVEMRAAFPELTLVRGHYVVWGDEKRYPHWWLTTPEGEVVDPTAAQFGGMPGEYVPHVGEEPTGRCLECGLYVFHGRSFCDDACARAWKTWTEEALSRMAPVFDVEPDERSGGEGGADADRITQADGMGHSVV